MTEEMIAHLKHFEGFRPTVYRDAVGIKTIGYGHRLRPGDGLEHRTLTEIEAGAILRADALHAEQIALRLSPCLAEEPHPRLDAVTDFVFNVGGGKYDGSILKLRVNQRRWSEAAAQMRLWVHAGGVVLPGLVMRREVTAQWLELAGALPPAA